jgi:hypothetical protein
VHLDSDNKDAKRRRTFLIALFCADATASKSVVIAAISDSGCLCVLLQAVKYMF